MGCLLTLDRGNSALKADVWDDDDLIETVVMPPACIRRQLRALAARHVIDDAIYCSVTDDGSAVSEVLADAGVSLRILDHDTPLPIKIGYVSGQTLGVDRIAGSILLVTCCWLLVASWRYPDDKDQNCFKELDVLNQKEVV